MSSSSAVSSAISNFTVGVIGLGFVGSAILRSFTEKKISALGYDKYNGKSTCEFKELIARSQIVFLCLPTPFVARTKQYDLEPIKSVCTELNNAHYSGIVVLKSTVEIGTTQQLSEEFKTLYLTHNPEFLSAKTAYIDFHTQTHIVLGYSSRTLDKINTLAQFYHQYYPDADISICKSDESEAMKLFVNNFYAMKVQIFNEFYLLCEHKHCNFSRIRDLMLKNKWINPMHTRVGRENIDAKLLEGKTEEEKNKIIHSNLSYGGYCFPKDTNALLELMKRENTPHAVLEATINERNIMRPGDNPNIV